MQRTAMIGAIILTMAGCDAVPSQPTEPVAVQATAAASATPTASPTPTAPAGGARTVEVENPLFEFNYAYPAKVGAIPGLKAMLDARLDKDRAELEAASRKDQAEAAKDGYPYRAHSSGTKWQVVTDLPRWLSLSAEMYEYSGGAHGMTFFDSLLWDREAEVSRAPADLFTSKAALSRVLREPFCAALDKERAKRRGGPVNRNSGDQFDECIDPVESTLILGSSNGRTFDKIGVLVAPYAAGSYAEGTFDLTLPVTQAVLATVKPEFRGAFLAR